MPQAVAVPLASAGIGALGSVLGNKKAKGSAYTPQQQDTSAAQAGITNLARMLQGQSEGVYNIGLPAYQRATGFYNSLLGSRTGQTAALAPALENTAAAYQGAQNALGARMQRGPTQDLARAELTRDSVGAARDMYRDAPFKAAEALSNLGLQGLGQAGGTASSALGGYASLFSGLNNQNQNAFQQDAYRQQQTQSFGSSLGSLFTTLLPALMGGKGKGTVKTTPTPTPTTNLTGYSGTN